MNTLVNPKVLVIFAIPLLVLIYLFANKPNSGTSDQMASTGNISPKIWHDLDLLPQKLPSNIEEVKDKVTIKQSEQNIGGAATYIQVRIQWYIVKLIPVCGCREQTHQRMSPQQERLSFYSMEQHLHLKPGLTKCQLFQHLLHWVIGNITHIILHLFKVSMIL